jgi:hypothetical protein
MGDYSDSCVAAFVEFSIVFAVFRQIMDPIFSMMNGGPNAETRSCLVTVWSMAKGLAWPEGPMN